MKTRFKSEIPAQIYRSHAGSKNSPEESLWLAVIKLTFADLEYIIASVNISEPKYSRLEAINALMRVIESKWFGEICEHCNFAHDRAIKYAKKYIEKNCIWPVLDNNWMTKARWFKFDSHGVH